MDSFLEITTLASLSVVAVQSILELNVVPLYFANKFPVLTNVVLSAIASVIVTWETTVALVGWKQWVSYVATVSVLAAITYNMTLRNSDAVQRLSNRVE